MIRVAVFREAAERILRDESYGDEYVEALDRECPGWRDLPPEVVRSELLAVQAGLRAEADRTLDTMNALREEGS